MIDLEIEGVKQVDAFLEAFPGKTSISVLRALKRGTNAARTHAARVVSKDMGLKVGDVRKRIRTVNPTGETMAGEIRGSLKRIPIIKFNAKGPEPSRGKGRGVRYRPKGRAPHAFLATMPTGHHGVFERKGRSRLPIRELYGPSIGRVMDLHRAVILARGYEQFETEFNRLLDRIIGRSRGV